MTNTSGNRLESDDRLFEIRNEDYRILTVLTTKHDPVVSIRELCLACYNNGGIWHKHSGDKHYPQVGPSAGGAMVSEDETPTQTVTVEESVEESAEVPSPSLQERWRQSLRRHA